MKNNNGYISLHRKILDNAVFSNPGIFRLFVYLLLRANYQDNEFSWNGKTITLKRGQLITGRHEIAKNLNENPSTVRNWLQSLRNLKILDSKTTNRYSIITIIKYSEYQRLEEKEDSEMDNRPPKKGQQKDNKRTQYNKDNKDNKETNNNTILQKAVPAFADEVNLIFNLFRDTVNPTISYGNTTQRKAVQDLINQYGFEKVAGMVQYSCSVQGERFAPVITSPLELKNKIANLIVFSQREKKNKINFINLDNL